MWSGGEDDAGFRADFHHADDFGQHLSVVIQHGDAFIFSAFTLVVVCSVKCRHPDAAAQSAACFDSLLRGKRIHPVAMHTVHAETAETFRFRLCLPDEVCPVVATEIIGLEHHGTVSGTHGVLHETVFIRRAFPRVGAEVQVDVAHSFYQSVIRKLRISFLSLRGQVHGLSRHHRGSEQCPSRHDGGLDEVPPAYFLTCMHSALSFDAKLAQHDAIGMNTFTEDCDVFTDCLEAPYGLATAGCKRTSHSARVACQVSRI